jgi:hypothetical protein
MSITEKHKQSVYKWRENNKDRYREICRKGSATYYEKHKEEKKKKALAHYYKRKAEREALESGLVMNGEQLEN